MNIFDALDEFSRLLEMELIDLREIKDEQLESFKKLIGLDLPFESLFFNDSYLLIADQSEYEELIQIEPIKSLEEALLIKFTSFNIFIWAGNFQKNKIIKSFFREDN
jgi:hypothetical protein